MALYGQFPKDFIWGAATSSYQIEGGAGEDGMGLSTWDVFCRRPGAISDGSSGDVACDHYHRYKGDVALMKGLGLKAYRFSISWPRVLPEGTGRVNQKGLDFYSALIDELLAAGIEPWVTIFHWDSPQALEERFGGWRSKEMCTAFAEYTSVVVKEYSDRVNHWMTMNEIVNFTLGAVKGGRMAPGDIEPGKEAHQTVHNAILAHGMAVKAIRHNAHNPPNVGIAEDEWAPMPLTDTPEDVAAARAAWIDHNSAKLLPILDGVYRPEFLERLGAHAPDFTESELATIGAPIDFVGCNIYTGVPTRAADTPTGGERVEPPPAFPKTHMGWNILPQSTYYTFRFIHGLHPEVDIYMTENGCACDDQEMPDGRVLDLDRVQYYRTHLDMCARAISDGIPLKGYFAWSLMDNFEWGSGYSKRFGIVRVDYETQERRPKLSAEYYAKVISEGRVL